MLLVVAKQRTDRFENFPLLIPSPFAFKWYAWIVVTLNPTRHSLIARYNAFALKWIRQNDYVFVYLLYCFWLLQRKILWISFMSRLFGKLTQCDWAMAMTMMINRILFAHLEKCSFNCFHFGSHNEFYAK